MKDNYENYEPYGEEWEKELMKLPKKFIIDLYRKVCIKLQYKESEVTELEIMYKEACNIAGMYEERAIEAEKYARDTYSDRGW